jgi:hypothetical protein
VEYADCLPAIRASHPRLAAKIEKFVTLEHVLNWLNADGYPLASLDMVTHDEFCHDLFLPLLECSDWLIFGMT